MPSWNIHTAHVERLLAERLASAWGIQDVDAFLLGNLVPDIYVGYMVNPITRKIAYRETHFADPEVIPAPDASLFYERFVQGREVSDLTLGAWTHLLCDHYYNLRTTRYIASIGVEAGEQTRIRKQADFDLFGRTLSIERVPAISDDLVRQAAEFPQYRIEKPDVREAIRAAERMVERNRDVHICEAPSYSLLTGEFFSVTSAEVDEVLYEALQLHATGGDPSRLGRSRP